MAIPSDESFLENPLARVYFFYCTVLALKMLVMSVLTGRQRFLNKAFVNPEDVRAMKVKPKSDENVERVRRAHLNDLENIPVFFVVSGIYLLTNPAVAWATLLFRLFTATRILHTFVYAIYVVPQPARGLAWGIGYAITGYMAFQSLCYFAA